MKTKERAAIDGSTGSYQEDAFFEVLPLLLGNPSSPMVEPDPASFHGRRTQRRYEQMYRHAAQLAEQGRFATGRRLLILTSRIGEDESSGYSREEHKEHIRAAESIARDLSVWVTESDITIEDMSRARFNEALLDPGIAHLMYIGHSNRSKIDDEEGVSFNWHEHPEITHLKRSFGLVGCAAVYNEIFPRFGSTFVDPFNGILYGVEGQYLNIGQPYHLSQLVQFPKTPAA